MGELDGVGEAVTGGLVARAVEPEAGEGHTHERNCLNCGAPLVGPHCHQCGQRAHVHRTIGAWWHDFVHSVLHLDGKLWRTLPLLAWRPGELTRRYVEGERARFVSPLALFLFSVFLMFALFSLLGANLIGTDPGGLDASFAEEIRTSEERIAQLEEERAAAAEAGRAAAAAQLERRIESEREDLEAMRSLRESGMDGIDGSRMTVSEGVPAWIRSGIEKAAENPSLLFYKVQANAYKFSWALIPISVPFLWLLFLHRGRYRRYGAYDHVVFVTYSIAFVSLLLIVLVILRTIGLGNNVLVLGLFVIPPIHMYRQLRGAYQLSRFSALWRTAALLFCASVALTLFFMLLLTLGVLG